jgi:hypothetical protein
MHDKERASNIRDLMCVTSCTGYLQHAVNADRHKSYPNQNHACFYDWHMAATEGNHGHDLSLNFLKCISSCKEWNGIPGALCTT